MSKKEIPNEKRAKELLIQLVHDIKNDVSDDPRVMISMVAILVGAVSSSSEITGEDVLSAIIGHLVENDLLHPEVLSEEEFLAMNSMPPANRLN